MEINDFVNCFIKGLHMYYLSHTKDGPIYPNILIEVGALASAFHVFELKFCNDCRNL